MKYHRRIIQFCLVLLLTSANEVASAPSRQKTNPTTSRPDPKLQEQSGGNSDRFFEAKTTREMDQVLGRQASPASLSFLSIVDRNGRIAYPNLQFLRILNDYQEEAREEINDEHWDEAFLRVTQLLKFAFALKETRTPEGMNSGEYNRSQAAGLFDLLRQKAPAPRVTEYRRQLEAFKQPDAALIAAVRRRKDPDPRWAEAMLYFAKEKIAEDDILLGPTNPKPPKAAQKHQMVFFRILLYGAATIGGAILFITLLSKAIESINLRARTQFDYQPIRGATIGLTAACLVLGSIGYGLDDHTSQSPSNGPLAIVLFSAIFGILIVRIAWRTNLRTALLAALPLIITAGLCTTLIAGIIFFIGHRMQRNQEIAIGRALDRIKA